MSRVVILAHNVCGYDQWRICYMIELDVKYCETIVKRYKKLNPKGVIKINGKSLNE